MTVSTRSHLPSTGLALALFLLALAMNVESAESKPRPISSAERAAVQFAAEYLAEGPEAFLRVMAADSPIARLPHAEALAEIEVRAGPREGATWQLLTVVPALADSAAAFSINFPSGIDETLIIGLIREGDGHRIGSLRILAEAVERKGTASRDDPAKLPERREHRTPATILPLGMLGFAIAAAGPLLRRRSSGAASSLMLSGGLIVFAALALETRAVLADRSAPPVATKAGENDWKIGRLLPLRHSLCVGGQRDESKPQGSSPLERNVAALWTAQLDLQEMRVDAVEKALRSFPSPSDVPLAEILRARLAFFRSREVDTVIAYERAINLGPGRDALWYEAAQAFSILGFENRSMGYLERSARIGSRESDVHYTLAVLEAMKQRTDPAELHLRKAWSLKPVERAALLRVPFLWDVLRKGYLATAVRISSAEEPVVRSSKLSSDPLLLPAQAESRVAGEFLHVRIDEQELLVPGGAPFAPRSTTVLDAVRWARLEEERALSDVPQLLESAGSSGGLTQPLLRRRIERAAEALAARNRWNDLLSLTASLSPLAENVPSELLFLRGTALKRTKDVAGARRLFTEMASSPAVHRKSDAHELWQIGEQLAAVGSYEQAIRVMERASTIREIPFIDERIRQISMNQRLAHSYSAHPTEHFEIHYPTDVGRIFAVGIGRVLEAELKRLRAHVPVASLDRIIVNIVWWDEFRSTYTGSDFILGFYDGKITLPFAGVGGFPPPVVAILSHELTHALIAQATNDQAPRWFQEGVAQRHEMLEYSPNALNMYDDDALISLSLLDAAIEGSADPAIIQEAYIEAQTVVRYIEAEYGSSAIAKMLASFRSGARTDEAISQLTGKNTAAFDLAMREWGRRGGAKVFVNPPPIRYDAELDRILRFSATEGE
ncbi:MAG TPA: hypothetical protein VMT00_08090 [Thermoanaerobaculia bacterium]|nr:hypothetical protein [Thermoanaerobaculia bacterium]